MSDAIVLSIEVEDEAWTAALSDVEARCEAAVRAALAHVGGGGAIDLLLTGDDEVQALNARFRGKDRPTNVLSFPAPDFPAGEGEARPLGDIVLAYGTCAREARDQGKPLADHMTHLVVHGVLHLVGYDHETEAEAEAMEAEERIVLRGLDIQDPYAPHFAAVEQNAQP